MPKDFGSKELIWTLTTNGKTEKVYASLKGDYQIDKQVMSLEVGGDFGSQNEELRTNIPPELEVQGEMRRTVKVGEPLTLVALAGDPDNLPARRDRKLQPRYPGKPAAEEPVKPLPPRPAGAPDDNAVNDIYRPPSSPNPMSGAGLRLSWIVYRGKASAVTFRPDQFKTWTDTRAWANSPWSPPFDHSRAATGGQVGDRGHLPGAGRIRAADGGQRRITVHLRKCDRLRYKLVTIRKKSRRVVRYWKVTDTYFNVVSGTWACDILTAPKGGINANKQGTSKNENSRGSGGSVHTLHSR